MQWPARLLRLLAQWLAPAQGYTDTTIALVALAVFLGHLYPVFFRFIGGKGVATAAGVLFALNAAMYALAAGDDDVCSQTTVSSHWIDDQVTTASPKS